MPDIPSAMRLQTLFLLDEAGRIVSTREPYALRGPAFCLVRGIHDCAWAVRADVSEPTARQLQALAGDESVPDDPRTPPRHAERYRALVRGRLASGPAFAFPDRLLEPTGVVRIDDVRMLEENFQGWIADEIGERAPIMAVVQDGQALSVCFCARKSMLAAEAGVETTPRARGRGLAARVTAAWAWAIRAQRRVPLYSTTWDNPASRAVARKLGLVPCGSDWSLAGEPLSEAE